MKGDFSKWGFNEYDNDSGVLHQQGRVLLDADWNARTQITNHWQDTAARDTIGPGAAAVPVEDHQAFEVKGVSVGDGKVHVTILPGRIWADGLLLQLEEPYTNTESAGITLAADYLTYHGTQPNLPTSNGERDAVILEVWREEISGFQEEGLLEPALGGPDTTERMRTAMALRLLRLDDWQTCRNIPYLLEYNFKTRGGLTVSLKSSGASKDPCPTYDAGGYSGLEHFLYRIEIADVDSEKEPHFKWSRCNGGLVGRGDVLRNESDQWTITVKANKGAITACDTQDLYLEILEDKRLDIGHWRVVYGTHAVLDGDVLTLRDPIFSPEGVPGGNVFFRIWNGLEKISEFSTSDPEELQDGIMLQFSSNGESYYRPGDYWTFPVRVGQTEMDPPFAKEPPQGIRYHRVPLAEIHWLATGPVITDCRRRFRPLIHQQICCQFTVGDGESSHGDFDSIQEAVDNLPSDCGGRICLLPGFHIASVRIEEKFNIRIEGCGSKTIVIPESLQSTVDAPIFEIKNSGCIVLEKMTLFACNGSAIQISGSNTATTEGESAVFRVLSSLTRIEIAHNIIVAGRHAIHADQGDHINIHHNTIRMLDIAEGNAAIFLLAEESVIERNDIAVVPADAKPADVAAGGDADIVDNCWRIEKLNANPRMIWAWVPFLLTAKVDFSDRPDPFKAKGGIQIGSGSEGIKIIENKIQGGAGNGITLGSSLDPDVIQAALKSAPRYLRLYLKKGWWWIAVEFKGKLIKHNLNFYWEQGDYQNTIGIEISSDGGVEVNIPNNGLYRVTSDDKGYSVVGYNTEKLGNMVIGFVFIIEKVDIEFDFSEVLLPIRDIAIDSNKISAMALSGIGTAQENLRMILEAENSNGKLMDSDPLIRNLTEELGVIGGRVIDLKIRNNRIAGCLLHLRDGDPLGILDRRGEGGISLGFCEKLLIIENHIEENGVDYGIPVCGIFVSCAAQIDISRNYIVNNGSYWATNSAGTLPQARIRGGIVIQMAAELISSDPFESVEEVTKTSGRLSGSAVRIYDNLVKQPIGPAFRLSIAFGDVCVSRNRFIVDCTSEFKSRQAIASLGNIIAGAVYILNLGEVQIVSNSQTDLMVKSNTTSRRLFNSSCSFYENITKVRVNQFCNMSQFIGALGDLGFGNNQSEILSDTGPLDINTVITGAAVRACENRFKEPYRKKLERLSMVSHSRYMNNTSNNQGDHCIWVANNGEDENRIDSNNCAFNFKREHCTSIQLDLKLLDLILISRNDVLNKLSLVNSITHSLLELEAVALKKRFGENYVGSKQIRGIQKKLKRFAHEMSLEIELNKIKVPEVTEKDALLHGRIYDENDRGIAGLTVMIENGEGKLVRSLGLTATDASGYYAFVLNSKQLKKMAEIDGAYLSIAASAERVVHREPEEIKVTTGDRIVVNVPLNRRTLYPIAEAEKSTQSESKATETSKDTWTVTGRVACSKGAPLEGLTVSLFDKELIFDDRLGTAVTDRSGNFEIQYHKEDFRDLLESNPDIYVEVCAPNGDILYSSRKSIRFEAGREEKMNIRVRNRAE